MGQMDVLDAKKSLRHRLELWQVPDAAKKADGFIDDLVGRGWAMNPQREHRPAPPKKHEACLTCNRHLDACVCGERATTPPRPGDAVAGIELVRAAMRDTTKEET